MAAAHSMSRHVLLSLSADPSSGSSVVHPERRITLTPENAKITIGRASKKTESGFVPALDNGWFDCAVMSRLHARIAANMDQEKLEIHDVGSLHGTYVNNEDDPIPRLETRELKDGDTLRFGTPVWRGDEQYVPTTVKVGIRFVNPDASASGTFQVPDSDDESDIDVSTDNDESGESAGQPSPTAQDTRVPDVIDLTGNPGCSASHQVIDLLSDYGSPISIKDDNDHDNASLADPDNRNLDDLDVNRNMDVLDVNRARRDSTDGLSDLGNVDGGQDIQMHDHAEDESEYGENSCRDATDGISNVTDDGLSSEYTSDDDSCELSDDQSSGLSDDQLNPPGYTGLVEHPETLALIESLSQPVEHPETLAVTESLSQPMPQPKTVAPAAITIMGLLNSDEPEAHALSSPRSLFRPEPEKYLEQDVSTDVSCSPTHNISAEYLGAKTGKTDFFVAREQNKLTLNAEREHRRMEMSLARLVDEAEQSTRPTSSGLLLPDAYRPSSPPMSALGPIAGDVNSSARRTHVGISISDIVDTHQQSPSNKRKADYMSECTREQERWAVETAQTPEIGNTNPRIATSQVSSNAEERASGSIHCEDNIFRLTDYCDQRAICIWEKEPNTSMFGLFSKQGEETAEGSVMTPSKRDEEIAGSGVMTPSKQGEEITEIRVITPPLTPERPAKKPRMTMVAERLGYAALGGVTAGAMIMGTLIYTAPTFG